MYIKFMCVCVCVCSHLCMYTACMCMCLCPEATYHSSTFSWPKYVIHVYLFCGKVLSLFSISTKSTYQNTHYFLAGLMKRCTVHLTITFKVIVFIINWQISAGKTLKFQREAGNTKVSRLAVILPFLQGYTCTTLQDLLFMMA